MAQEESLSLKIKADVEQARKDLASLRGEIRKLGDSRHNLKQLNDTVNGLAGNLGNVGAVLRKSIAAAGIGLGFKAIIDETVRAEAALTQVEARIKSTGGAAGINATQMADMAKALQQTTTFSDEAILEMDSVLLAFDKIQGDVFRRTTVAALDLSVGLGQDLKSSALELGKALQDPVNGLTALGRAGVRFSQDQQTLIENFVRTGDVASAQKVILDQVEKSFGGAAHAARDTFGGALAGLHNAFKDLLEAKGGLKDSQVAVENLTRTLQDPNTAAAVDNITTLALKGVGALATLIAATHFAIVGASDDRGKLDLELIETEKRIARIKAALEKPRAIRGTPLAGTTGLFTAPFESEESLNKKLASLLFDRETYVRALNRIDKERGAQQIKALGLDTKKTTPSISFPAALPVPALIKANLDAQTKLMKDALDRQSAELDRQLAFNLVSYHDFYTRRTALQQGAIDQDIKNTELALSQERTVLATRLKEDERIPVLVKIKELETELILLRSRRAEVAVKADTEELQAGIKQLDTLDQVRERLATAQGQTASARRSALEREFTPLVAQLEASSNKPGIAKVENLINTEVAKTRLDEFQRVYNQALEHMQATETDINTQRDAGLIGELEARRRIVDLHKATNAQLAKVIPKMREAAATAGPEAQRQVEQLADAWRRLGAEIDPIASRINTSIESGLADGLESFINRTKSAKEAFQDFGKAVVASLERIAAENLASSVFKGFNLGSAGTAIASMFHAGGVVGAPGPTRAVSPLVFLNAPRFHGGGIAGLTADEIPAILKRGEVVLRSDQIGAGGGVSVMVNVDVGAGTVDARSPAQNGARLGQLVGAKVREVIANEKRPGGLLAGNA